MRFVLEDKYWKIIFFIIIASVSLLLRLHNLNNYSLWYDEASYALDERGLSQIHPISRLLDNEYLLKNQDYLALYNHGIIYYWQKLVGKSEFLLRMSSVIFSLLSIYIIYLLGRHAFNVKVARIASILLAISPLHIYYAQELRPYAAICFLATLSVFLLIRALETGKKRYWTAYAMCSIANVYFHCAGLLILFSICIFFAFNAKKYNNSIKSFVVSHAIIALLLLPIFLTLYPNVQFVFRNELCSRVCEFPVWAGKPTLKHLLATFKSFSIGYNVSYHSLAGKLISITSFFLFLFGALKFSNKTNGKLLLTVLFVPVITLFMISQIKPLYVDRYLFSVFPLYILGIAAGLARLHKKYLLISLIIIIGFYCFGLKSYYANLYPQEREDQYAGISKKLDIREAAHFIAENYTKGDGIVHTCKNTVIPLKFYIKQVSSKPDLIETINQGKVYFVSNFMEGKGPTLVEVDYQELHPTTFLPSEFKIVKNLTDNGRLWVIFSSWNFQNEDSEEYNVIKKLHGMLKLVKIKKFDGYFLYIFDK